MVERESLAPFFLEKKMIPGKQREDVETLTLIPQRSKLAILLPDVWS